MSSSARGSENSHVGGQYESRGFESENKGKVEGGETSLLNSSQWKEEKRFLWFCAFRAKSRG